MIVRVSAIGAVVACLMLAMTVGCTPTIRHEHKIEPLHITMDINLRVDRELDNFFDFQEPAATPPAAPTATTPGPASQTNPVPPINTQPSM